MFQTGDPSHHQEGAPDVDLGLRKETINLVAASPDRSSPVLMPSSSPSIRFWKEAIFCFSVEETRSWLEGVLTSFSGETAETNTCAQRCKPTGPRTSTNHRRGSRRDGRMRHKVFPQSEQGEIQLSRSQRCQVPCSKLPSVPQSMSRCLFRGA